MIFLRNFQVKPHLAEKFGLQTGSFIASFVARAISIVCSFPLEYRATVQMTDRESASSPRKMGNYTTGLTQVALRNMTTTIIFFQIYEKILDVASNRFKIRLSENTVMDSLVKSMIAGGFAGAICGIATYPFEVIRVMKIYLEPTKGKTNSREIYEFLR